MAAIAQQAFLTSLSAVVKSCDLPHRIPQVQESSRGAAIGFLGNHKAQVNPCWCMHHPRLLSCRDTDWIEMGLSGDCRDWRGGHWCEAEQFITGK